MNHHYEDYLDNLPLFLGCSRKERRKFASLAERVNGTPGQILVAEGTRTKDFWILRSGTASVTRQGVEVARLGPGDHFGELAILDPGPRNATVMMTSAGEVLCLAQREFWTLLRELPALRHMLLASLAQRVHELERRAPIALNASL